MGMVWVKEERIGLEEDCLERKEKLSQNQELSKTCLHISEEETRVLVMVTGPCSKLT